MKTKNLNTQTMKELIRKGSLLCVIVCLLTLVSCNEDAPQQNPSDAISKSLIIANGTYVKGKFPEPSSNSNAPQLETYHDGEQLFAIQGSKIIVNAELWSGTASGFYVQVDGADGYYKINSTDVTLRRGKRDRTDMLRKSQIASAYYPSFSIEIPDNMKSGEFCISYCVYAGSLVSNIIQQCVVVNQLGGANSEFLTANQWSAVRIEDHYDGETYSSDIGTDEIYSYQEWILCGDSTTNEVEVNEIYRTNVYLSATQNGSLSIENQFYEKYLDWYNSNCTALYIEETTSNSIIAAWSYDEATRTLIFIYNDEYEGEVETIAEQYKVELVNGNLILTYVYSTTDYAAITFEPK
jgi:hypothetical protein